MHDDRHRVTTLSRQLGSGGTCLGYLQAKKLDFAYVDREIIRQAAQHLNTGVERIAGIDGRSAGLLASILQGFALGTPETAVSLPSSRPIYNRELFTLECRIMNDTAESCKAVIIGRAGFHALRKRTDALHVFTHAAPKFRIERLMKVHHFTDIGQARAEIEESDRTRANFIKDMTGANWTDSLNYHLCIDLSKVQSARMIMNLIR